ALLAEVASVGRVVGIRARGIRGATTAVAVGVVVGRGVARPAGRGTSGLPEALRIGTVREPVVVVVDAVATDLAGHGDAVPLRAADLAGTTIEGRIRRVFAVRIGDAAIAVAEEAVVVGGRFARPLRATVEPAIAVPATRRRGRTRGHRCRGRLCRAAG